ncbi:MAG TPA: PIG-L family deacetylase [Steroidobacter sp.]|nr:PIG-L family deacetylase [Steroidobacter sp.]
MSFRSKLRPLKRACARPMASTWEMGFRCAAGWSQPAVHWRSPGGQRVLVVAPHPDDEAIGCGGTILRHVAAADYVCVAIATDGRRSRVVSDPAVMAQVRRQEAENAARLLGVARCQCLGFPEGEWRLADMAPRFDSLLAELSPQIVYAPSLIDFHPEHLAVAHALADALSRSDLPAITVRIFQVQVPLTRELVNLVCDITSTRAASEAALRAYASQSGSLECTYRQRRYSAARHGIVGAAEEFWEMGADRYSVLHRALRAYSGKEFRGLRSFPLSDPLAFLVGGQARRAARRIADRSAGIA